MADHVYRPDRTPEDFGDVGHGAPFHEPHADDFAIVFGQRRDAQAQGDHCFVFPYDLARRGPLGHHAGHQVYIRSLTTGRGTGGNLPAYVATLGPQSPMLVDQLAIQNGEHPSQERILALVVELPDRTERFQIDLLKNVLGFDLGLHDRVHLANQPGTQPGMVQDKQTAYGLLVAGPGILDERKRLGRIEERAIRIDRRRTFGRFGRVLSRGFLPAII